MIKKALAILFALPALVLAFPSPQGYVSDFAGVMAADRPALEYRISEYHKKTGVEIAVVTIVTLNGENIDDYANRLFKAWGVGKKGTNNGLLILIAVNDHKTRIEVGYGLEGRLTDAGCGRIIREQMIPEFKRNQFGRGVGAALTAITQKLGE